MARTIGASRPVGPAGYGATAQGIMDEMTRRNPGAFMGDRRAQEAMALQVLQGIGQQELARDVEHQGRAAQAILSANQQETRRALDRERLEDMKAAADDWRPKVARIAGSVAPAIGLGALAYEQYAGQDPTPEPVQNELIRPIPFKQTPLDQADFDEDRVAGTMANLTPERALIGELLTPNVAREDKLEAHQRLRAEDQDERIMAMKLLRILSSTIGEPTTRHPYLGMEGF